MIWHLKKGNGLHRELQATHGRTLFFMLESLRA